jgi:hypothetical protein
LLHTELQLKCVPGSSGTSGFLVSVSAVRLRWILRIPDTYDSDVMPDDWFETIPRTERNPDDSGMCQDLCNFLSVTDSVGDYRDPVQCSGRPGDFRGCGSYQPDDKSNDSGNDGSNNEYNDCDNDRGDDQSNNYSNNGSYGNTECDSESCE